MRTKLGNVAKASLVGTAALALPSAPASAAPPSYGLATTSGVAIGGWVYNADPIGPYTLVASGTVLVADAPWIEFTSPARCANLGATLFGHLADCNGARDANGRLKIILQGSNDHTDRLTAQNPAPNVTYELLGRDGRDALTAKGTPGVLDGGAGNDTFSSVDGVRQTIKCGAGFDTVVADFLDDVGGACESVSRK